MTTEVKNVYLTCDDNKYYGFTGYVNDKNVVGSDLPDFIFANNYSITNQEYYSIPQQKKFLEEHLSIFILDAHILSMT